MLIVTVGSGDHAQELASVLEFTALSTVNRRRQRELVRVARQDPLTGALNRRALEERLETFLRGRSQAPAMLLLVDVDNLKAVNDTLGHHEVDQMLRRFTSYARSVLRVEDDVARIGGDEFVWVLYDTRWDAAAGERLRQIVRESPLGDYGTSATVGVVELPREAASYAEAYRLADQRLYRGKAAGKSTVVGGDATDQN